MVRTILGIFLLLCSLGLPARALPPSDSPGSRFAAQDAMGTVWGISPDYNSLGTLQRWQTGAWAAQTVPGAAGFRAQTLASGDDGSVYAFWQTPNPFQPQLVQSLVTVHRGVSSRILAHFSGSTAQGSGFPNVPTIYVGAKGDVWIPGTQALLWHISPDSSRTTFPTKSEQYFDGKMPGDHEDHTISSLTDGEGRRWFYQSDPNNWQLNRLRGVLIWDGKTLDYHPTLQGLPDRPFSYVAPLDTTHFWGATISGRYGQQPPTQGALYRVNTHTLSAEMETPPQFGAFQNIMQIFRANGDWYVVARGWPDPTETILWRKQAGQWRKCLNGLKEIEAYYPGDLRHPWLSEPSGVWLGASGGAWWLPRTNQPALWVNWRRGLPVLDINGLFPLANGLILAVGPQGAAAEMPATPQPLRPLPPGVATGGLGAPKLLGALLADQRQHLWGTRTFYTQFQSLDEWDGKRWRTHPVPRSITGVGSLDACDTLGRLWLATTNWTPPAQPQQVNGRAVYDPAHDTWTNYTTMQDALQAAAALPGKAFLPYRNTYQPAVFSGDGRVTYASGTTIFLYDGHVWKHWQSGDILPDHGSYQPARLYFNQDRHLEIAMAAQIFEWTSQSGWKRIGEQKPENYANPVPLNGPHGLWATPAVDSQGGKWFVWQGAVFTARGGVWAKQEELSGPGSPFRYGYGIEDVLRDPAGRLFFVTRPAGHYDLVVWSPPPVPRPTLSLVPAADDSVTVRFGTSLHGPHWFLWRLNGGAWSAPQTTNTVALTALRAGDYRVEVQALDCRLQTSTMPAAAVFSIRVAPGTQVARWVRALLHGTNSEREAAVAGLIKQPDAALPALGAARSGASESGLWWIEAAIQQITDQAQESQAQEATPAK